MVLTCYNNKWKYYPTIRINVLNYNNPFSIVKLHGFNFPMSIVRCYNKGKYDLAYKKADFVEILNVGFYNIIFNNYILEKLKLSSNNL